MTNYTFAELEEARQHAFGNAVEVQQSTVCFCYFCNKLFGRSKVVEWLNPEDDDRFSTGPVPKSDRSAAFCPNCGFDMVLGDASGFPLHNSDFTPALHAHCERRSRKKEQAQ